MKKIALLITCIGLFSCTTVCDIAKQIMIPIADTVVTQCQCANAAQVQADFLNALNVVKICKPEKKAGQIADIVCPIAGDIGTQLIATKVFSPEWKCAAAMTCVGTVMNLAVLACKTIPL